MHYSDYGYEYIPPSFRPVTIPPALTIIRNLLFGSNPDNYFLNFRVNELMSYLHATELAEYVYKLDNRVTYWPRIGRPYFEPSSRRVTITQIYGRPMRLNVAGNLSALTAIGKAFNFYTVSLRRAVDNGASILQMEVRYEGKRDSRFTVAVPNLKSPPIVSLPDTELNLRLNPSGYSQEYSELMTEINDFIVVESYDPAMTDKLSEEQLSLGVGNDVSRLDAQWLVETKVNPAPAITTVMSSMELLGEPVYLDIFGVEDKEPYLTFKNLWFDHPLSAYRLSGIVLALIYRTEELRGKNV
jgi:hypothetical protein